MLPSPLKNEQATEEWDQLERFRVGGMLHDVLKENPTPLYPSTCYVWFYDIKCNRC